MMRLKGRTLVFGLVLLSVLASAACSLDTASVRDQLKAVVNPVLGEWRYKDEAIIDGFALDLNDSEWKTGSPEFEWSHAPTAWLRKTIIIPERIGGFTTAGSRVTLYVGVDDEGIIYVNGQEVQRFHWDGGKVVLTKNAVPGERFMIAIKGINTGGPGRLLSARLEYSSLTDIRIPAEALLADLDYAQKMAVGAEGDEKKRIEAMVADAWSRLDMAAFKAGNKDEFLGSIARAQQALQPLAAAEKQLTCHLVGHAHIDMNWLWLWPETIDVCKNTFTSVTNFMDEFPEFCFSQSQPSTYVITEENFPELDAKIAKYIKEGRWEITGGTWVEGDLNMASGEAIVRQILYAKRYFKERFGIEPEICWSPDTFGHAWTIPQILVKSGIKYYYFCRCGRQQAIFWWEGPEGSRVLAYNDGSYNGGVDEGMVKQAQNFNKYLGVKDSMVVYGVGDHGGGPTREHIMKALEFQKRTLFPTVKFSTAKEYFDTILKQKQDFPVIKDELNFIFEGCYTTHADIKRMNRQSETILPDSEALSAIASFYGMDYPTSEFVSAWQDTCFNQFHDILDGSAIHGSYDYSKELFERATSKANAAKSAALEKIVKQIQTEGQGTPVVVFNTLSWPRTDVVTIDNPFKGQAETVKAVDARGDERPCQVVGDTLQFVARDVPSMGYKVFWLSPGKPKNAGRIYAKGDAMENEFFKVRIDQTSGAITSIYDKINKREIVPEGKSSNLMQILMEKPHAMSAWNIGEISSTTDLTKAEQIDMTDVGVLSATAHVDYQFNDSTLVQEIVLYDGVPRIDIRLTVDWKEQGTGSKDAAMLKAAFPVDLASPKARFEIPFGSIEREANGREVPAQKWIDLSTDDYGVSLLNNCKYGHDVKDNVMRLTLLRSSYEPDPTPDQGIHEMTYSLYPHKGTWKDALTVRRGYELNVPLIPVAAKPHKGNLPALKSFVKLFPENVAVTAFKLAEDGDGYILRFYEWAGKPCTVKIITSLPVSSYVETDLMERNIGEKTTIKDGTIEIPVGGYEIKTVKLYK